MSSAKHPVTQAVRALRAANVTYEGHLYDYVERGGTAASAAAFGVPEHIVIKTIVLEDERARALVALMHGDASVSTKALARHLGVKLVRACDPAVAERHTGYKVGGTSPFGLKRPLPVFAPASVLALPRLFINGGARGFLVTLRGVDVVRVLSPTVVECATS
ncbi:MAG: aminoacyl-tRNA deacylase [Polyangiales bacterium]|nr:aminoacyl-tRNA deacylase [Myxococcales bacterium]MCB9657786.1 aminoacyl-tRNA deacylase [Sandaracinaceae bacterium]